MVAQVSTYAILLFGGEIEVDHERQRVTVDKWLWLDAPARIGGVYARLCVRACAVSYTHLTLPTIA